MQRNMLAHSHDYNNEKRNGKELIAIILLVPTMLLHRSTVIINDFLKLFLHTIIKNEELFVCISIVTIG